MTPPHAFHPLPALSIPLLALAFIAVAAALAAPDWEAAFRSDESPVSWLSGVLLAANAALCARLGVEGRLPPWLALTAAPGLAWLAVDEQFLLHEHWKYGCADWLAVCRDAFAGHAGIRELPTVLVGVIGLPVVIGLGRCLPGPAARLLALAWVIGAFALGVDLVQPAGILGTLEEAWEVLAESLFLGALLGVGGSGAVRLGRE